MPSIGCDETLTRKASGLALAGQDCARLVRAGEKLPSTFTVHGERFAVTQVPLVPGGADNAAAIRDALAQAKANTILIAGPDAGRYHYAAEIDWPATPNLYLLGYGATLRAEREAFLRHQFGADDQGILGLHFVAPSAAYTRWPERWELSDKTKEASKFDAFGDQTNDSTASWIKIHTLARTIVKDCTAEGAMRGFIRASYATDLLVEGCAISRTHSDSIHLTKNSRQVTVRKNSIFDAGDDAISVVSYDKASEGGDPANTAAPSDILIEENRVKGGRARGITVVGGDGIVIRRNYVTDITLAGVRLGPADQHKTFDVTNVSIEQNVFQRCGLKKGGDPNSGIAVALLASSTRACRDITVRDNQARTFGEHYSGSSFVRTSGTIGNLVETGNVLEPVTP